MVNIPVEISGDGGVVPRDNDRLQSRILDQVLFIVGFGFRTVFFTLLLLFVPGILLILAVLVLQLGLRRLLEYVADRWRLLSDRET